MVAKMSWDQKDKDASKRTQGPWHPTPPHTPTGTSRHWGSPGCRGSFGQITPAHPTRSLSEVGFLISAAGQLSASRLSPAMPVMESLFTGHRCHPGTPARAACRLPGTQQQQHVPGTDKGLPNRMLGA